MANEARKELKLRIKYEADTRNAQDANKKMVSDLERTKRAADDVNRSMKMSGTPGGGMGRLPSGGGGAGGMGMPSWGGIMSVAGPAAAITAAVGTLANLTKAVQGLDSPAVTARDRLASLTESIPILGSALGGLTRNITDAIERLRDPELAKRRDLMLQEQAGIMAEGQIRFNAEQRLGTLGSETRDAELRSRGFAFVPGQSQFDSGLSALGGVAPVVGTDPRMREAQEQVRRAQREFEIVRVQRVEQEAEVRKARDNAEKARLDALDAGAAARRAEAGAGLGPDAAKRPQGQTGGIASSLIRNNTGVVGLADRLSGGRISNQFGTQFEQATNQAPAQIALMEEQQKIQQALQAQSMLEKELMGNKQKMLEFEQKRYQLMQAETGLMKTRLSLLQEEENKVRAGAQQFAAMDQVSQRGALDALERFKTRGREGVTEGEFNLLQSNALTKDIVGKKLEADFGESKIGQDFLKATGARDLKVIEQERMKVEQEIKVKIELDEEQYNKLLAAGLKEANKELEGLIRNITLLEVQKLKSDIATGRIGKQ